jgi:hypothetical protein
VYPRAPDDSVLEGQVSVTFQAPSNRDESAFTKLDKVMTKRIAAQTSIDLKKVPS